MSNGASAAKSADSASRSRTSQAAVVTPVGSFPAFPGSRLMATTFAPPAASSRQAARPMPDVPPKTRAFRSLSFIMISSRVGRTHVDRC
jgi:hypothetical protein